MDRFDQRILNAKVCNTALKDSKASPVDPGYNPLETAERDDQRNWRPNNAKLATFATWGQASSQ